MINLREKYLSGRNLWIVGGLAVLALLAGVLVATVLRVENIRPTITLPKAGGQANGTPCAEDAVCQSGHYCITFISSPCQTNPGHVCGNLVGQGNQCCGDDDCSSGNCNSNTHVCDAALGGGSQEQRCRKGIDCGDCSWVANYYVSRDKVAACDIATLGIQCLKNQQNNICGGEKDGCGTSGYHPPDALPGQCYQIPYDMCKIQKDNCGGGGGGGCNQNSPSCVWGCYQHGANGVKAGNCSGCQQYCSGGGGGGGGGGGCNQNSPSCVWGCFQHGKECVKSGNCSGCQQLCNGTYTCPGATCSSDSDCSGGKVCCGSSCVDPANTHLSCSGTTCTRVCSAGANTDGCTAVGQSCTPGGGGGQTHLECVSNACASVAGGGGNLNGCMTVGQSCNVPPPPPPPPPPGQVDACWGNRGTDGKCYDCNGDGVINILDFSCFAACYNKSFSGGENPSCLGNK